jgi:predicted LPLAT superfamily acyltransferase
MSPTWRSRRERSNTFTLWLIRTLALHGGRRLGRFLLYPITAYYVATSPASRRASRAYLGRVLCRPPRFSDVWRHFFSFASVILDRVFFLSGRDRDLQVDIRGAEQLLTLREQGRGALLIGAHVGSFDAARALGRTRTNLPLRVLMDLEHNPAITRLLDALNPDVAATVIQPGRVDTALRVQEALEAGEFVGILADRVVESGDKCLEVDFLGTPAPLPLSPMRLAIALHAPVILFLGLYQGGNHYVLHFERLDDGAKVARRDRDAYAQTLLRRYASSLETELHKTPYNWFNFYDFWARH